MQRVVFVVDDNDINLSVAKEALKEQYKVFTMPSAAKMFSFMEKMKPDMILLDIEMPEMNGFEALTLLKNNSSYAGIPVIFLSGTDDASIRSRGLEQGVTDFILKPFSAEVLQESIKNHLVGSGQ